MILSRLHINDFRNLTAARMSPGPQFNLLVGDNGAGKSSILEAIHTLGTGKSFRVSQTGPLVRVGCDRFSLYAEMEGQRVAVGIEKALDNSNHIVINGDRVHSASQLATLLPVQHITLQDFQLFEGGPKTRRRFLDWGVFHVEHHKAGEVFRQFERAIKQRNSVLKSGKISAQEKLAWDQEFIKASGLLDEFRTQYVECLMSSYRRLCETTPDLAFGQPMAIEYVPGWDRKLSLEEALNRRNVQDRERRTGTTQIGPHRADLKITWHGMPARDMLSRGQMKMLGHGLKLAQIQCLTQVGQHHLPVILLDDLAAELDTKHLTDLLVLVRSFNTQVFLTVLREDQLPDRDWWCNGADITKFSVDQGQVHPIT